MREHLWEICGTANILVDGVLLCIFTFLLKINLVLH